MDILQYFDSDFEATVSLSDISGSNKLVLIIYIEDLLKLANERLSEELNWILESVWEGKSQIDFTSLSKTIRKSLQRSYFDTSNKKTIIDYILSLSKQDVYGQFVIEKAIEILGVIVQDHLYNKIAEINIIFNNIQDFDQLLAKKRQNSANTLIAEVYQHQYLKELKKKNKYTKQEWNISNLTPGTVFMQSVIKQFQRSNLDFIQCQYKIIEDYQFGNADFKLKQLLKYYNSQKQQYNLLIFARSRQTILQLLNYCNENESPIYFQLIDIINLPEYDMQPINMLQVTSKMSQFIHLNQNIKRTKKDCIRELICLISIFRNPVIQLPVPVEYYSIPCILAIYRQYLSDQRQHSSQKQLIDSKFNINIQELANILEIIGELNDFYQTHESEIKKKPNLLFLHIIDALTIKQGKIQIRRKQLIKSAKLFPDQVITTKSTLEEINTVLKYSDFYYEEPDILFLNLNYVATSKVNISKSISKILYVDNKIKSQIAKRSPDINSSNDQCLQYLTAIQKVVSEFKMQERQGLINTFNFNYILYPDLEKLIQFCTKGDIFKSTKVNADTLNNILDQHLKKIYLKPILFALLTIPCDYLEVQKQSNKEITKNTSQYMFPREVQLNLIKLQKQFPNIINSLKSVKYQFETGVTVSNLNVYNHYIYNVRFKDLIYTESQLFAIFNELIPFVNKLFIPKV